MMKSLKKKLTYFGLQMIQWVWRVQGMSLFQAKGTLITVINDHLLYNTLIYNSIYSNGPAGE